jgi:hypothetical protein
MLKHPPPLPPLVTLDWGNSPTPINSGTEQVIVTWWVTVLPQPQSQGIIPPRGMNCVRD